MQRAPPQHFHSCSARLAPGRSAPLQLPFSEMLKHDCQAGKHQRGGSSVDPPGWHLAAMHNCSRPSQRRSSCGSQAIAHPQIGNGAILRTTTCTSLRYMISLYWNNINIKHQADMQIDTVASPRPSPIHRLATGRSYAQLHASHDCLLI